MAERLAVCNDHTELARIADVLEVLGYGGEVAIVSDAGTPGISDPGERIVRAAIDAGHTVSACPVRRRDDRPRDQRIAHRPVRVRGLPPPRAATAPTRLAEIAAETRTS